MKFKKLFKKKITKNFFFHSLLSKILDSLVKLWFEVIVQFVIWLQNFFEKIPSLFTHSALKMLELDHTLIL